MLEAFCEMYPQADIYTLIHKPGSVPESIEKHKIYTSFLNSIPGIYNHYRKFLPLFPIAVQRLVLKDSYDLIISSSHCVIKGVKKNPAAFHMSYIYTPMRYMYDQFDVYFGPTAPLYQRLGAQITRSYITDWDKAVNSNVDQMVAISHFVKDRIREFYNIEASVIYPFADLKDFSGLDLKNKKPGDFYLMVSAFAPNKRCDLAIEAFNTNGKKLKIVGSGQQEGFLRKMAKSNIEFLGPQSRKAVIDLMSAARGFVFPGIEDFGITPLESLAAGTPVIAYKAGGVLETLNTETGLFFKEQTVDSLVQAIDRFEGMHFDAEKLKQQAHAFSKERFFLEMEKFIHSHMKKTRADLN